MTVTGSTLLRILVVYNVYSIENIFMSQNHEIDDKFVVFLKRAFFHLHNVVINVYHCR